MLAVIPAKGGSTRLPRKNARRLGDKPLVGWTIESALDAGVFTDIVVSSEDDEILDIASRWSVECRSRPKHLAVDPAGCIHVAQHVRSELEREGRRYAYIAILMPTCPFRSPEDIRAAAAMAHVAENGAVLSVSEFSHTPYNGLVMGPEKILQPLLPERFGRKAQELPVVYRPNGAIFIMNEALLKRATNLYMPPMRPYLMSANRSVDIDNEIDLEWAEFLVRRGAIR